MAVDKFPRRALAVSIQLVIALSLIMAASPSPAENNRDIWQHYSLELRARHYTKAAELIAPLAEQGEPRACYELSQLYRNGRGVAKDEARARSLLQSAAQKDHVPSQYLLGIFYSKGIGGPDDTKLAQEWLQRAAQHDHTAAIAALNKLKTKKSTIQLDPETICKATRYATANNADSALVQLAIQQNRHRTIQDDNGNSLLTIAIIWGDEDIAEKLLTAGVDINHQNRYGETAVHLAVQTQNIQALRWLLKHSAKVEQQNISAKTALHIAVERDLVDYADLLLAANATPRIKDSDGQTALEAAGQRQQEAMLAVLASYGFRPKGSSDLDRRLDVAQNLQSNGITALQLAVERDDLPLIKKLLQTAKMPWRTNAHGHTLITLAAQHASPKTLAFLLQSAKGAGSLGPQQRNALFFALDGHANENLDVLLKNGTSPLQEDTDGSTAIDYALAEYPDAAMPLITSLAPSQWQTSWLPVAAEHGQTQLCELLLAQGLAVDSVNKEGKTALWYASRQGQANILQMLLDSGANVLITDNNGNTAAHIAASYSPKALEKLLTDSDTVGILNTHNHDGDAPIHLATAHSQLKNISLLIKHGVDINSRDSNGNTPLILAVLSNSIETIEQLLAAGASTNKRNKHDQDALTMAKQLEYSEAVTALEKQRKTGIMDLFK